MAGTRREDQLSPLELFVSSGFGIAVALAVLRIVVWRPFRRWLR